MNNMNNQKVGLTVTNWVLSILGILILSLLIILPPVFRVVFKEEEVIPPTTEPIIPITTTTCTIQNRVAENYTEQETIIFEHRGTELEDYTRSVLRTYLDPTIYESEKQRHGVLANAFTILDGYTYSVSPHDDTLVLEIDEIYHLGQFQESMLVVPGDSEPTVIQSKYQLKDSIPTITQELTNDGYTCTSDSIE